MPAKGICLIWPRGRLFSPSLSCRGQGIGKHRGTISSWHKRTAGRNLVVHRHGTTLRHSVQRYRCRLYFSLFFSHFDIKRVMIVDCFFVCTYLHMHFYIFCMGSLTNLQTVLMAMPFFLSLTFNSLPLNCN